MEGIGLTEGAEARAGTLGLAFLARIYEVELARRPGNLAILGELGNLYTQLGRYDEGLAVDRRLVLAMPEDATAHYNLACSLALTGDPEGAFEALERALERGFDDATLLRADADLASLRDDPRFAGLIARLDG